MAFVGFGESSWEIEHRQIADLALKEKNKSKYALWLSGVLEGLIRLIAIRFI
jgi:hypothetical protein